MNTHSRPSIAVVLGALFWTLSACADAENADKTPLAASATDSAAATAGGGVLPAAAQAALAAGNEAYRAGRFDDALTEYNKAVATSPASAAPYYGVLMAAQKLGNKSLADSASAMIQKLSGEDASIHTGTPPANPHPPRTVPKTSP